VISRQNEIGVVYFIFLFVKNFDSNSMELLILEMYL